MGGRSHRSRPAKAEPGARAERQGRAGAQAQALALDAERWLRAGELARAAHDLEAALACEPRHLQALHGLAVVRHHQGRNDEALTLLARLLRREPRHAQARFHRAEILRASGRFAAAVDDYRRALRLSPRSADLHYGLGTALLELARPREAAAALERAAALAPDDAEIRNNLGNAFAALGRHAAAIAEYRAVLARTPASARSHCNLALSLIEQGDEEGAERHLRQALAAAEAPGEATPALARLLQRQGRDDEARALLHAPGAAAETAPPLLVEQSALLRGLAEPQAALERAERAARLAPRLWQAHHARGLALVDLRRAEAALAAFEAAAALAPRVAEVQFNRGVALQALGRFGDAAAAHRRALALDPGLGAAHLSLALLGDSGDEAALHRLADDPASGEETRIAGAFALARLHDRRDETEAAFARLRQANERRKRQRPFDPAAHRAHVDQLAAVFDADFFAARAGIAPLDERPIFVVGMPRSGTSLVEQILASHPAVHGAGELEHLRALVRRLPDLAEAAYPTGVAALAPERLRALAGELREAYRRHAPAAQRVVDKMPGNYLRLGLVGLLLPGARVIHCRRDPRDVALSCYQQDFSRGLAFTYDLAHLAVTQAAHDRLMAHWQAVLANPLHVVDYEALVADQERETRRLLAFCGLPWDEACLAFHRSERAVMTASFWQVRQPLYAGSVGRWRRYAAQLDPFRQALADETRPRVSA